MEIIEKFNSILNELSGIAYHESLMKKFSKRGCHYFFLCMIGFNCIGCSVDPETVEEAIENVLKIDIPNEFEITKYREGGLNDYSITYQIKFTEAHTGKVLSKLNLDTWIKYREHIYTKDLNVSKREQIRLYIDRQNRLINYVHLFD